MVKSMTGYGHAKFEADNIQIAVEIKTLNSKFLDVMIKLPKHLTEKELDLRNLLVDKIQRGKVNINIDISRFDEATVLMEINDNLFLHYYNQLKGLADKAGANPTDIFRLALQYPDVVISKQNDIDVDKDWSEVLKVIQAALDNCNSFREKEGMALEKNLRDCLSKIRGYLAQIDQFEAQRLIEIKAKIKQSLTEIQAENNIDQNRFEQELIYYLEKLDISEEKVRLTSHLDYFEDVLNDPSSQGKKLNFISQEMGREINTIGSKASYAPIQKLVVSMKDELEKIKEQVLNII